jgi:hypothetical protein
MHRRLALCLLALSSLPAAAAGPGQPAVVELFTSQGCSSCPPANAAVAGIADRPDVLALSFGVTYWDRLGWTDTFGHKAFTERQWAYARHFKRDQVYTPQVVVNGQVHGVGARRTEIERMIRDNRRGGGPTLTLSERTAAVGPASGAAGKAQVWMVRYDPRTIQVPIRRGENGGKTLPHRNVVRELVPIGIWAGAATRHTLPAPTRPGLNTAVLVQGLDGRILAAAKG